MKLIFKNFKENIKKIRLHKKEESNKKNKFKPVHLT